VLWARVTHEMRSSRWFQRPEAKKKYDVEIETFD